MRLKINFKTLRIRQTTLPSILLCACVCRVAGAAANSVADSFADTATNALPRLEVPRAPACAKPLIDGDTSDAAWRSAALITPLSHAANIDAQTAAPLLPTTIRALWDEDFLYIAFDCVDDEVYSTGTLKRDDNIYMEDVVEVFLDGIGDGRQYMEIQVAPDGATLDLMYLLTAPMELAPDGRIASVLRHRELWGFREWDAPGLQTAARRTVDGWSAELAIPAAPIMKRRGEKRFIPCEIRAQFIRYDHVPEPAPNNASGESKPARRIHQQNWSPVLHGNPHTTPSRMGILELKERGAQESAAERPE